MNLKKMTCKFFKQSLKNYKHNLLNRKENCAFKPITYQYMDKFNTNGNFKAKQSFCD